MQKINYLNNDFLRDKKSVKEYLEHIFRIRRTKKNPIVYANICKIYDFYPDTICQILDDLPILGYYKDYFYLLINCKNEKMIKYIYNIIVKKMSEDMKKLFLGKEISTLGKWLPREKSTINKKCNFIDKFNKLFFPTITNKMDARHQYRKMKTLINEKIGTLESKICAKKYDSIDYDKVAPYAFKKSQRFLTKRIECLIHLENYQTKILNNLTLSEFTKEIFLNKHSKIKMTSIWNQNKFHKTIPFIDKITNNIVCFADLSNDTYNKNGEFFTIGMILLIDQMSNIDKKIIIGNKSILFTSDIYENVNILSKQIGHCNQFNVVKSHDLCRNLNPNVNIECLIFITTKNIEYDMEYLNKNNIKLLHFNPCYDTFNVKYYDGEKIFELANCKHNNRIITDPNRKNILKITNQSYELNNNNVLFYFLMIFILVSITALFFL